MSEPGPIALVGIGCRFPGGVDSPLTMWGLLAHGREGIREVPPDRWSADAFYDPDPTRRGRIATRHAGFIDEFDRFDAELFGISAREAATMDPQHRLLLEVAWAAIEDAGRDPSALAGSDTAVFVGLMLQDYLAIQTTVFDRELISGQTVVGMGGCMAANRISHAFDLRGPSVVLDTACSSSLVAVHLACQAIRGGDATQALVGGVNLMLRPEPTIAASQARMLAPDGRCKGFDASADGYARSEGGGVLFLRPLADAIADGDRVYAVIRGSATNQDGRTSRVTVPSGAAQQEVIRAACRRARVEPGDLQYVEAHGTGTPVGDPIEARALGAVVGRPGSPCVLGSIKSNIGHVEAAAGVAAVIKTALALHHDAIPPHLHFSAPPRDLDLDALGLRVPTALEPWPTAERRLAGVNSFGLGGTNAHLILEGFEACERFEEAERAQLIVASARTSAELERVCARLAELVRADPSVRLADLALSCARRAGLQERVGFVAHTRAELLELIDAYLAGDSRAEVIRGRAEPELDASDAGDREGSLRSLARLYVRGAAAELGAACDESARLISLPSYPFAGERHWVESEQARRVRLGIADAATARPEPAGAEPAPVSEATNELVQLREAVAAALELEVAEIDDERPLSELGLDSVAALDLAAALERGFGVRLAVGRLLEGPSVRTLLAWLRAAESERGSSSWLLPIARPTRPRLRLLCIPYAGGSATVFRPWAARLPEVELWAVRLPGSLDRERERPVDRMQALVDALIEQLDGRVESPFAIYGHSLGALIGLALARELRARGLPGPSRLLVAAHPSPSLAPTIGVTSEAELDALLSSPSFLREVGYFEELADDEALMRTLAPALGAAVRLFVEHRPTPEPRLDCPIVAYVGADDQGVDASSMRGWAEYTSAEFGLRTIAGGHLFVRTATAELTRALRADLGLEDGGG